MAVLVIAGSDSGGGAGIQADAWAVRDHGVLATTAVTAITAQNTRGVRRVDPLPLPVVRAQIDAVLDDLDVRAIKVGMLGTASLVSLVAEVLRARAGDRPVIVDPVMVATSGDRLLDVAAVDALRDELLPLATLVTPNVPEAAVLADGLDPLGWAHRLGRPVLLTGGDAGGDKVIDVLVHGDQVERWVLPRIEGGPFHGTGCTLASAVAARLARGEGLIEAVDGAIRYVRARLSRAWRPGGGSAVGGFLEPAELATFSARSG